MADLDDFFAKKDKSKKKSKSKFTAGELLDQQNEKPKKAVKKKKKKEENPQQTQNVDVGQIEKLTKSQFKFKATMPPRKKITLPLKTGIARQFICENFNLYECRDINNGHVLFFILENKKSVKKTLETLKSPCQIGDEEWQDYEDETEKDYSGLRIQNLQLREEAEEAEKESENREDGEEGSEKREADGPWKTSSSVSTAPAPVVEEAPQEPTVTSEPEHSQEEEKPAVRKYVPPAQRAAALANQGRPGASSTPMNSRFRKKTAPNLESEDDFPTLGFSGFKDETSGARFENVRSGGRRFEEPVSQSMKLQLGNKFDALQSGTE